MKVYNIFKKLFFFSILLLIIIIHRADVSFSNDIAQLEKAHLLFLKGDFSNSLNLLKEISIKINNESRPRDVVLYYELNGIISHLSGDIEGASKYFNKAYNFIHTNLRNNPNNNDLLILKAKILLRIGSTLLSQGKYTEAINFFNDILIIGNNLGNSYIKSIGYFSLGLVNLLDSNYEESLKYLNESFKYSSEFDEEHIKIKNLILLAFINLKEENIDQTIKYINNSINLLKNHDESFKKINLYFSILNLLENLYIKIESKEYLNIYSDILNNISKDLKKIDYKYGEILYYLMMAKLYEKLNDIDNSLFFTRKALFLSQENQYIDLLYKTQWQLARLYYNKGDFQRSLSLFQSAFNTLESIKSNYVNVYIFNISFNENPILIFYLQYSDLLLKLASKSKNYEESQKYLYKAREVMERSKITELQNYFKDECVIPYQSKPIELDNISNDTSIIYPIVFNDRIELLVTFPNKGINQYTIHITSNELTDLINNFRILLEKRTTHQYKTYSRKLYDILFSPIHNELVSNKIKNLVVVPDNILRTIPISALFDGEKFLVEKFSIAITPGLTLTNPQKIDVNKSNILLSGITLPVDNFPPLPAVEKEINKIKNIYNSSILKDESFTKSNLIQSLKEKEFDIIHIASHGLFQGRITETFLLAYDGKISMDFLQKLMTVNTNRERPIELLTLSACDTAAGDDKAALGLAGVAVKAGARSAFATLWQVSDEATSILVGKFYENLKVTKTKSEALQKAQISLIADENFNHPYYWSPFLIIGNWL